ncbi:MAG: PAS domain S-box protein [Acidobacteria bacterium]|nr:PAS domain S-box protein [Acidobacteriota bacterium]
MRQLILEENTRVQQVLDAMPDGVLIVDGGGRIVFANAHAEALFGCSASDLIGQFIELLVPEAFRAVHERHRNTYAAAPATRPMGSGVELHARRRDGSTFPVDISLSPVEAEQGTVVVAVVRDATERTRMLTLVRQSEELYRMVVEKASEVFYRVSIGDDPMRGRVEFVSPQCETLTGHAPEAFLNNPHLWIDSIHPDDYDLLMETTKSVLSTGTGQTRYYRIRDRSGQYHRMADRIVPWSDRKGRVGYQGVARDITERVEANEARQRLERELAQAQKMEAVGRLAGGIAHDFNNLLTIILGYCDMLLPRLDAADPSRPEVEEIAEAGRCAANLTQQLLGFSRRQIVEPKILNLNTQLLMTQDMLRRLIGEDVTFTVDLQAGLWPTRLDPSQLTQVAMNLAANARDAMPTGGSLVLTTANAALDEVYCATRQGCVPGQYVELTVSDTGTGMDPDTLAHVFEPFFTTKPEGRGTGLGLATIYGIVKQNGGFINVHSDLGHGTRVSIYFPRYVGTGEPVAGELPESAPVDGTETVLLVEDNDQLRRLTQKALTNLGYTVLDAPGADVAYARCREHRGPIHLLLTDVVMPLANGVEVAAHVTAQRPGIRVVFMSGFAAHVIADRGALPAHARYLQKPFNLDKLAAAVREALDAAPPDA